jgi:hypothetical protein
VVVLLVLILLVLLLLLLLAVEESIAWESVGRTSWLDEEMEDGAGAESVEDVDETLVYEDEVDGACEDEVELDEASLVSVSGAAAENDEMFASRVVDGDDAAVVSSTEVLLTVDGGTNG